MILLFYWKQKYFSAINYAVWNFQFCVHVDDIYHLCDIVIFCVDFMISYSLYLIVIFIS